MFVLGLKSVNLSPALTALRSVIADGKNNILADYIQKTLQLVV